MRKSIITVLAFIMCFSCFSQKGATKSKQSIYECDIEDNYDEFTKERTVLSGAKVFYSKEIDLTTSMLDRNDNYTANIRIKNTELNFYFYARWENGKKVLGIAKSVFQVRRYLEFPDDQENAKIIFLLSNGDPLTLIPNIVEGSELQQGGIETQRIIFEVDDNTWEKIRNFPPKKMRIRYKSNNNNGNIYEKDIEIEEKNRGLIPAILKCIDDLNLSKKK